MYIQRVAKVYDPDVDALPPEFRDALTDQDVAAIRAGPAYFAKLAGADSPKWLRKVLAGCSKSMCELQFLSTNGSTYRPFFRFYWEGEPAISLPRAKPLRADLPEFLRVIYGLIGVFNENGFDIAGGLHAGDELEPLSDTGMWVEQGGPIDPGAAIPFLETLSGSQLCYLPGGKGAWLESGQFLPVKDLEKEVARYFEALIKGSRI